MSPTQRPDEIGCASTGSCRTTSDLDKLARAVLDALTGIAFEVDRQVADLTASKQYGEQSGATVTIETIGADLEPLRHEPATRGPHRRCRRSGC